MPWNDPMGDSSDPGSSNYGGREYRDPNAERAGRFGGPDLAGLNAGKYDDGGGNIYGIDKGPRVRGNFWSGFSKTPGGLGARLLGGAAGWAVGKPGSPEVNGGGWKLGGDSGQGGGWDREMPRDREGGGWGTDRNQYLASGQTRPLSPGGTTPGKDIYPSVYSDPVTGRLLYQSMSPGGTSNQGYADQSMIDQLMGTKVAGQNVTQEISNLQNQIAAVKKAGGDTSWYENELMRLQGLGSTGVDQNNPMLAWLNSGLQERVSNEQLDNTVANTMKSSDELAARRGLGNLRSPMQDAVRASLGLSTGQARNQNKLNAGNNSYDKKLSMLAFLKNSQGQDFSQGMGRTGIGMTLGDWENQRKIAEIAQRNQNNQFGQNMDFLRDQQGDVNRNAWLNTIGNVAGGVDWGSFF